MSDNNDNNEDDVFVKEKDELIESFGRTITALNYNMGNILKQLAKVQEENKQLKKENKQLKKLNSK